jgi:hypothetical protein
MRTLPVWANCPLGLGYLILRGKARRIVLAPGGVVSFPWHMGCLTRRGHFLHFRRRLLHHQNPYGGWWFLGSFEGISRSRWRDILNRRGRLRVLPGRLGAAFCFAVIALLFIPMVLAWGAINLRDLTRWGIHGWRKAKSRRV